mgnify:CR=1 FL=1
MTIHAPNNRYVNDAKVAQAVAQMLTRVGIATKVEAMPSATYFPQATDLKFSFMLLGWSSGTGEASTSLKALLATYNKDKGFGTANRGRYSNPKVDALLEDALATVDDAKREALLQRADRARDQRHRHHSAAFPGQLCGRRATASLTYRAPTRIRWRTSSVRRSDAAREGIRARDSPPLRRTLRAGQSSAARIDALADVPDAIRAGGNHRERIVERTDPARCLDAARPDGGAHQPHIGDRRASGGMKAGRCLDEGGAGVDGEPAREPLRHRSALRLR